MSAFRTRVKFCGMTQRQDVADAVAFGVDAIGLVFYQKSARCVSIEQAKALVAHLPPFVECVAVFVNPDPLWVTQVMTAVSIQYLQFHGEETASFCEQFHRPYIKAVAATSSEIIQQGVDGHPNASAVLLDSPNGGTGTAFDWQIVPKALSKPLILAGGINEHTVQAAIGVCAPYALDLCSGVERSPGIKDRERMQRFMEALR